MQGVAGGMVASFAVAAFVAGYMMGNENSVAHFNVFDFGADFVDDASCLVTQNNGSPGHAVPLNNIAAAYAACHNLKQRFILADFGNGHFFNADVMVVVVDGGKQEASPRKRKVLG